jgi:predicted acetyltransferase
MNKPELRRTLNAGEGMKIHLALSDDETDVSRLWAPTFDMRIGSAIVKMGGIAGVGTNEEHRMRGYSRLVMEESTRYFTETGHDVAVLFGIPDFYHKFGYVSALPVTTLTVKVKDALLTLPYWEGKAPAAPDMEFGRSLALPPVRPLQDDDWGAVLDVYNDNHRTRTGTLLRWRETWQGYPHGTEWRVKKVETFVVENAEDEIIGYVAFDDVDDACRVGDLGYATPAVFPTLLQVMVEQAQRRNAEEFEVKLPPDHPFVLFCRHCGGAVRTVYQFNRGGMARIIHLRSLFEKLTGLLTERLTSQWVHGSMNQWSGGLELQTDLGAVTLEIGDGRVRLSDDATVRWSVSLPQMQLTQLVMGYRSVGDVTLDDNVDVSPDVAPLLDALFPVGHPWMAIPDWF